jgi:shikimate dehydrogenase
MKNYRSQLVGAFGDPIDENPTGVMEEAAFAACGLDYRYLTMLVRREDLSSAMQAVRALNMRGVNLTIPHKVEAVRYVDTLSEAATIIGAINVVVNEDGHLYGDNTDGKGFLASLESEGVPVRGRTLTVLGAGGASRAICVECALAGAAAIHVFNHDRARGETLVALLNETTPTKADFISWEGAASVPPDTGILVNATSVGLYPHIDQKPDIRYDTIAGSMMACDVIFNDPNSLFLREARTRGARTIHGLGMLVRQGALNFTLWTGQPAPLDVMERTLRQEFSLESRIS